MFSAARYSYFWIVQNFRRKEAMAYSDLSNSQFSSDGAHQVTFVMATRLTLRVSTLKRRIYILRFVRLRNVRRVAAQSPKLYNLYIMSQSITFAPGDGIGPEIMNAVLHILESAQTGLSFIEVPVGLSIYKQGHRTGITPEGLEAIKQHKIFLKGPIITQQGGGNKSVTVTIRKSLGLFANVRPVRTMTPYIHSHFPEMDVVVVRENEEDLYMGMEYALSSDIVQSLKIVSRSGCERIIRFAFEYAVVNGRHKVTCMTKDNILKHADGLFHKVFDEVAQEYPDIENEHHIIDIGSALLAHQPERFDVVVTMNLYGDILSDITTQIAGSVGLGGSANIGSEYAMFEAVHGSAPDIAGKGIANPSGLLLAACMLLDYIGKPAHAVNIRNAWRTTIEAGIHTGDIYNADHSTARVNTKEFAQAVIDRLQPDNTVTEDKSAQRITIQTSKQKTIPLQLKGADVFIRQHDIQNWPQQLAAAIEQISIMPFKLEFIANRGLKVYPGILPETHFGDVWRCRLVADKKIEQKDIFNLLDTFDNAGFSIVKFESLFTHGEEKLYSEVQG